MQLISPVNKDRLDFIWGYYKSSLRINLKAFWEWYVHLYSFIPPFIHYNPHNSVQFQHMYASNFKM